MLQNRRRSAILLTVLLVFAMATSSLFLIAEADHDCIGEDCPVCQQLCICARALQLLSLTLLIAGLATAFRPPVKGTGRRNAVFTLRKSLVSHRVKLTC